MMKKRDYRPKIHFSPEEGWMNDPNGMVYVDGVYHFFYQKYPYDTSWGPMHWATGGRIGAKQSFFLLKFIEKPCELCYIVSVSE